MFEYKDTIDEQNKKIEDIENILEEEADIDFYTIPISGFPPELEGVSTELWFYWVKE